MVLSEKVIVGERNKGFVALLEVTISEEVFFLLPDSVVKSFEYATYDPLTATRRCAMTPRVAHDRGYCSLERFERDYGVEIARNREIWQAGQLSWKEISSPTIVEDTAGEWS